jgi:hypothetical protein
VLEESFSKILVHHLALKSAIPDKHHTCSGQKSAISGQGFAFFELSNPLFSGQTSKGSFWGPCFGFRRVSIAGSKIHVRYNILLNFLYA